MPFSYYSRLSPARRRIYDRSDAIERIALPDAAALRPLLAPLEAALAGERRAEAERLCATLAAGIVGQLRAPPLRVAVLAVRPSSDWGELHGLYLPEDEGKLALIKLWMRTAKNKRVVAYRSFLRTLLHELCHHLDYELYRLEETFHTEGFYKRESSLFNQLLPKAPPAAASEAHGKQGEGA
ncbi:MAG TPA: hypothetical protein PKC23_06300 [Candidatus Desulfobacillus sp.]|nr:hypothetical protein [Candidatus Desulfobacillus sp.]